MHLRVAPTKPPCRDRSDSNRCDGSHAAIPFLILFQARGQGGIGRDIEVNRGEHNSGKLIEPHRAAGSHLPTKLEGEDGERDELEKQRSTVKVLVVEIVRDDAALNDSCRDEDEKGLDGEGDSEGAAQAIADAPHDGGKDHGAKEEGRDGGQGFEPAVGLAGGEARGAQSDEDCVACLHADEAAEGSVGDSIAETCDQRAQDEDDASMGSTERVAPA